MHVQDLLRSQGLAGLVPLGINVREYPDRVTLNYDMIESPKHDPVVKECRALILRKGDWSVLARSFDRFYNEPEDPNRKEFDWRSALIEEKVDGSLMSVYHDGVDWQVATRSMAYAEGITPFGMTFADIFWSIRTRDLFRMYNEDYTFVFEMVSPETRVITPYPKRGVCLLTVRNRKTGIELDTKKLDDLAIVLSARQPRSYSVTSLQDLIEMSKSLPAMEEGYVARVQTDAGWWRIKVKNPSYLAIAHLRNNGVLSIPRVVALVLANDEEEYLGYFPEDRHVFEPFIRARVKMYTEIQHLWELCKDKVEQKDFALTVSSFMCAGILFQMRKGSTAGDAISRMTDAAKERLLLSYKV